MKRFFINMMLIVVLFMCATGCDSSNSNENGSIDGYISYGDDKILESYEEKTLQEGITYKLIEYNSGDNLGVYVIVYNNTDDAVYVSGSAEGYFNGNRTKEMKRNSEEMVLAHSSNGFGFLLSSADDYKISNLKVRKVKSDAISNETYSFIDYKIEEEYNGIFLKMYFRYNGTGENLTNVKVLGFKNGKLIGWEESYINYVDKNLEPDYKTEITTNGEMGVAEIRYNSDKLAEADKLIYFVRGYYKN